MKDLGNSPADDELVPNTNDEEEDILETGSRLA